MSSLKRFEKINILEAALYAAGRPVNLDSLKSLINTKSEKKVISLLNDLTKTYDERKSALEIKYLSGNRVVMKLRQKYDSMVKKFTQRPLLTRGPLKTLSYIAYHQPIEQVKVVAKRGNSAYVHLRIIEEMGLITREKLNERGYILETTPYFSDYFGFGQDIIKAKLQLRQLFDEINIHKLNNGDNGQTDASYDFQTKNVNEKIFTISY
jgi:segregation and condensation protein B